MQKSFLSISLLPHSTKNRQFSFIWHTSWRIIQLCETIIKYDEKLSFWLRSKYHHFVVCSSLKIVDLCFEDFLGYLNIEVFDINVIDLNLLKTFKMQNIKCCDLAKFCLLLWGNHDFDIIDELCFFFEDLRVKWSWIHVNNQVDFFNLNCSKESI